MVVAAGAVPTAVPAALYSRYSAVTVRSPGAVTIPVSSGVVVCVAPVTRSDGTSGTATPEVSTVKVCHALQAVE